MRLHFDTHVLIALMRRTPVKRHPALVPLMAGSKNKFASVASLWEMLIKARLGCTSKT